MNGNLAAVLLLVFAAAVAGAIAWVRHLQGAATKAGNDLDNEELKEAHLEAEKHAATETDAQATEELRARLRPPPPGPGKS